MVTLDQCHLHNTNVSFNGIFTALASVSRLFIGRTYNDDEAILFNKVSMSIEGAEEWVNITGIEFMTNFKSQSFKINYKTPRTLKFKISKDFELHIVFQSRISDLLSITEGTITHATFFEIISKNDAPP